MASFTSGAKPGVLAHDSSKDAGQLELLAACLLREHSGSVWHRRPKAGRAGAQQQQRAAAVTSKESKARTLLGDRFARR